MKEYMTYFILIIIGICLNHLWSYIRELERTIAHLRLLLRIYEGVNKKTQLAEEEESNE